MNTDIERLICLLNLTTSDNDHESLSAIRKANEWLIRNKKSWDTLITGGWSNTTRLQYVYPNSIPELLEYCLERITSDRTRDFLESLECNFEKWGKLSEKQTEALKKIYNNLRIDV